MFELVIKRIYILFLLLNCMGCTSGYAQERKLLPQPLLETYVEQRASFEQSSTKQIDPANQKKLDEIVDQLKANAPDSYEYHLVKYINGNFDTKLKDDLLEAYRLAPADPKVLNAVFGYYVLVGDLPKQKEFAAKIKKQYSENTLAYYKCLFLGKTSGVMIMSGEKDAYPAYVLQVLGIINSKVKIVNLDFLQNDDYRKKIQDEIGGFNMKFLGNEVGFVTALTNTKTTSVFVSTTVSQNYLSRVKTKTYITGLTYEFNEANQRKHLDTFWNDFKGFLTSATLTSYSERALYGNFLPPLLTLYKLKIRQGEKDVALREGILKLAKILKNESTVNTILTEYDKLE